MNKTIIDEAQVFDSEGTLALMSNGLDLLHLLVLHDENHKPMITPDEHQKVIDAIVEALGV